MRGRLDSASSQGRVPSEKNMSVDWPTARTNKLIQLWNQGVPTSKIGEKLGVTKNAVVGKANRLGLPKRQSPIKNKNPTGDVIKLEKLSAGMCSWPEGDPGTPGFRFCGKPTVPDKPYCAEHCERAYVKSSRDRKETEAA